MWILFISLCLFGYSPLVFCRQRQTRNENLIRQGMHSVIIHFPRSIFEANSDWKYASHVSTEILPRKYERIARSQDQEDIILYENWFYGVRNGIVIESGALDGYSLSNSYFFEHAANWTSVNIEANPSSFFALKENRPNAINIFAALCNEEMILHYIDLHTLESRGFVELMSDEFIKKYHPDYLQNKSVINDYAAMKCSKFTSIWRMLDLKVVDLWILDVEGAELSVLQGVDFSIVRINVIVVEMDLWDASRNRKLLRLLESNSYHCCEVVRNYICKHSSFQPSSKYTGGRGQLSGAERNTDTSKVGLNWRWIQESTSGGKWVDLSPEVSQSYIKAARGQQSRPR